MKTLVTRNHAALSFPNSSRSFDAHRNCVRFWGYDSAIEISFFVEAEALRKFAPEMSDKESDVLKVFDAIRNRIHRVALVVYKRGPIDAYAYNLMAKDFLEI